MSATWFPDALRHTVVEMRGRLEIRIVSINPGRKVRRRKDLTTVVGMRSTVQVEFRLISLEGVPLIKWEPDVMAEGETVCLDKGVTTIPVTVE